MAAGTAEGAAGGLAAARDRGKNGGSVAVNGDGAGDAAGGEGTGAMAAALGRGREGEALAGMGRWL